MLDFKVERANYNGSKCAIFVHLMLFWYILSKDLHFTEGLNLMSSIYIYQWYHISCGPSQDLGGRGAHSRYTYHMHIWCLCRFVDGTHRQPTGNIFLNDWLFPVVIVCKAEASAVPRIPLDPDNITVGHTSESRKIYHHVLGTFQNFH